ncbi:MAG: hypothetical protein CFH16_00147 [Alphaproteobacteria bacterium MarineAlpha5_Bin6]|nr:MAG: hypothetical protein CFH17_01227 [Alphaproteobacteria bacterium MarineAlpha5_Bin7]PPR54831.1 MAG: hypothetical protein CFH16_00147 [Alphaproteobacteria bacterium MarineAlpha5_Bin6]|tara:strand:- start:3738 stop:4883 length:1146 start_codon:yes stop_codon:yes gene_type:complete
MPTLKGISWDHPRGFAPMEATALEYKKKNTEVEIIWDKRPLQAFADRPIEEMAYEYDLMVIDHPHVGEASRKELLIEFDKAEKFKNDLSELAINSVGLSHKSYEFNNHQYALAIDAAAPVAAYRPGSLEDIPDTFEEVIKLAENSKVILAIKPVDSISYFNSIAANIGYPINKNENEFMDKQIGLTILKLMKKLSDLVPMECLSMNPINVLDYMSANEDKLYCPILYGYSNYSREGFRKNLIKFTNIPSFNEEKNNCKGSQIGGTGLAISSKSKNKEVALDYAFYVASEICQKDLFYFSGGQPGHISAWKDQNINIDCNNFFEDTLDTLEKAWLRPRYDGYMYFQDVGGTIINNYLSSGESEISVFDNLTKEFEKSFYVNK